MTRPKGKWLLIGVVILLLWPTLAFGLTYVSGEGLELKPLLTTVDNPANHVVPVSNPGFYAGVAKVLVAFGSTWYGGSGALLRQGDNLYLVTAGHLLYYNNSYATAFNAYFPGLSSAFSATAYYIHPNWTGDLTKGYDVALVRLNTPVPNVTGYEILRQEITGTVRAHLNGYGISGQGKENSSSYPYGTLRQGDNTFGEALWNFPGSPYAYDFDNGSYLQNVLRSYYRVKSDTGLGKAEVMIAPGDSGGPTFINGYLAGIHSFGATVGRPYDVDRYLNSSYGELGGDTRLALVASWIDQILGQTLSFTEVSPSIVLVPLPSGLVLFSTGLALVFYWKRRTI